MSKPRLPAELLDQVVDNLHGAHDLQSCCLVSKSWIPRTRKHLFAKITFTTEPWRSSQSWKNTFPDPSTSPAYYTKILIILWPQTITAADAEEGGWIPTFSRVLHLTVRPGPREDTTNLAISLIPFHGFSPVLKSLFIWYTPLPSSSVFDLVRSFPLLEDLALVIRHGWRHNRDDSERSDRPTVTQSSSSLAFTGSLTLSLEEGVKPFTLNMLPSPGGLHFRRLDLTWKNGEDASLTTALVEMCSSTLEYLTVDCERDDEYPQGFINLSKATKLKGVQFSCQLDPQWITTTLRTITRNHKDLRHVLLDVLRVPHISFIDPGGFNHAFGDTIYAEWLELDRLFVQLSLSHPIFLTVLYPTPLRGSAGACVEGLLPEATTRGVAHMIEGFLW